jgi:HEPN domain-containing protein
MTPLTEEWVQKAEGDWQVAEREFNAPQSPNYDAVCFHCQQCAEKYLKARLNEAAMGSPRAHNLLFLLDLILPIEPDWERLRDALRRLDQASVQFRYPGAFATGEIAREMLRDCRSVRAALRASLSLP